MAVFLWSSAIPDPKKGNFTNTAIRNQLEATPAAIVVTTPDEKVIYWNGRGEALFGYSSSEAVGRFLSEMIVPPAGLEEEKEFLQITLETGVGSLECNRQRKNGSQVYVYVSSKVLRNAEGEIEFVLSSIKDMTRVRLLMDLAGGESETGDEIPLPQPETLRESEEQLRLFVESAEGYACCMLSPEGLVVSWNGGAARVLGYHAERIIGRNFSCFYPAELIELGNPEWDLRTAEEQGHSEDEGWRLREDGQRFWASLLITVLFTHDGLLRGFAMVMRDLTQQHLAEAMHYENIDLQNAAEAKNRFLASMSHELRTPLNGIIGFADFLVDGKPGNINAKQKEYLEEISNSGKHLLVLITDILELAKAGAGEMKFDRVKFSLRQAIEEACALARPIALKKSVRIEVNVSAQLDEVTLDPQKFKQVLYSLFSNAIKFNHNGGKVEIRAEPHGPERFRLTVSDNGVGITAEDIGKLFKNFEQVKSGASRPYEGAGLGLALARKIVELQGGTIGVESQIDKGSSFSVVLPLVVDRGAGLLAT
jgi:PAS domain S-box-containing protein